MSDTDLFAIYMISLGVLAVVSLLRIDHLKSKDLEHYPNHKTWFLKLRNKF